MTKKIIKSTEHELVDLVKECVLTYFHLPTNTHKTIAHYSLLSDSKTEDVAYGIDVRCEYLYENLNEGLILSYDINRAASYLKAKFSNNIDIFSLQFNLYKRPRPAYYRPKANDFVSIDFGTNFSDFKEISDHVKTLLGWFTSEVFIHEKVPTGFIPREFYNFNGDFICPKLNNITLEDYLTTASVLSFRLIIEAKYGEKYVPEKGEIFYHATEKDKLKKILTQGLCPESHGNFPERVYLGRSISEIRSMVQSNLESMVILQVDASGLSLYRDGDERNPVYTYDTIHPSKISVQ